MQQRPIVLILAILFVLLDAACSPPDPDTLTDVNFKTSALVWAPATCPVYGQLTASSTANIGIDKWQARDILDWSRYASNTYRDWYILFNQNACDPYPGHGMGARPVTWRNHVAELAT